MTDRLVLGSAQIGMAYGIGNKTGKPDLKSACEIVKTAFDQGIRRFDTAQVYGDSEEVLGIVFDKLKLKSEVKVYSKLDPKLNLADIDSVLRSVEASLRRLKINRLEGLLLHHEDSISSWTEGLHESLDKLVGQGKIKSLGASFYYPSKALTALDIKGIDLVQLPANIFDRRFEEAGVFKKANDLNKRIYIRSVFLQGLLLMKPEDIPGRLEFTRKAVETVRNKAALLGMSVEEFCLGYVIMKWPDARIVFGAETAGQVRKNTELFQKEYPMNIVQEAESMITCPLEERVINTLLWPK